MPNDIGVLAAVAFIALVWGVIITRYINFERTFRWRQT